MSYQFTRVAYMNEFYTDPLCAEMIIIIKMHIPKNSYSIIKLSIYKGTIRAFQPFPSAALI